MPKTLSKILAQHVGCVNAEKREYGCYVCGKDHSDEFVKTWIIEDVKNHNLTRALVNHFNECHPDWEKTRYSKPQQELAMWRRPATDEEIACFSADQPASFSSVETHPNVYNFDASRKDIPKIMNE